MDEEGVLGSAFKRRGLCPLWAVGNAVCCLLPFFGSRQRTKRAALRYLAHSSSLLPDAIRRPHPECESFGTSGPGYSFVGH